MIHTRHLIILNTSLQIDETLFIKDLGGTALGVVSEMPGLSRHKLVGGVWSFFDLISAGNRYTAGAFICRVEV